jgi:hypothetical protein
MFPSHSPQQCVIASQLVAELAEYDRGLTELLEKRWDPDLYRSVSDRFDRIEMLVDALPHLSSSWTEFLISRVDLTHALWSVRTPSRISGKVVAMHAQHRAQIQGLLRGCSVYTARQRMPARAPAAGGRDDVARTPRLS